MLPVIAAYSFPSGPLMCPSWRSSSWQPLPGCMLCRTRTWRRFHDAPLSFEPIIDLTRQSTRCVPLRGSQQAIQDPHNILVFTCFRLQLRQRNSCWPHESARAAQDQMQACSRDPCCESKASYQDCSAKSTFGLHLTLIFVHVCLDLNWLSICCGPARWTFLI